MCRIHANPDLRQMNEGGKHHGKNKCWCHSKSSMRLILMHTVEFCQFSRLWPTWKTIFYGVCCPFDWVAMGALSSIFVTLCSRNSKRGQQIASEVSLWGSGGKKYGVDRKSASGRWADMNNCVNHIFHYRKWIEVASRSGLLRQGLPLPSSSSSMMTHDSIDRIFQCRTRDEETVSKPRSWPT